MKRIKTAFRQAVKDKLIFGSAFAEVVAGDQSNDERKYFVTRDIITKVIETCRVFEIDMTACPQCGGPLTLIAGIEDPTVIAKILTHQGWPTRAPPRAPARRVLADGLILTGSNGLIPPWLPVQFSNRHSLFAHFPLSLANY